MNVTLKVKGHQHLIASRVHHKIHQFVISTLPAFAWTDRQTDT